MQQLPLQQRPIHGNCNSPTVTTSIRSPLVLFFSAGCAVGWSQSFRQGFIHGYINRACCQGCCGELQGSCDHGVQGA